MDENGNNGGMRLGEVALVVVIVGVLLATILPGVLRSRNAARDQKSVTATLRRIETAKQQFAMDRKKKPGDPVSMRDLVEGGYLDTAPKATGGGEFVVGAVGTPVEYDTDGDQTN